MEMEILRELIEDIFDESEIGEQTDFYEDLGADWLDMVELMYACEEEFDVGIGEDAMREIGTVGELSALVRRLTEEK